MKDALPPFTPLDLVRCVMCGSKDICTQLMQTGQCLHSSEGHVTVDSIEGQPNPRQHRECRECGHAWDERTLQDSPETHQENLKRMIFPMSHPETGEFYDPETSKPYDEPAE